MHRVSVKQIKNKLPEVHEFAKDVIQYMPKFMDFRIALFEIFKIDFEIRKLFTDCYNRLRQDSRYIRPRTMTFINISIFTIHLIKVEELADHSKSLKYRGYVRLVHHTQ